MREMKIAYGSSCFTKVWSNKTITFDALCERLKNTIRTPETVEEAAPALRKYGHSPFTSSTGRRTARRSSCSRPAQTAGYRSPSAS